MTNNDEFNDQLAEALLRNLAYAREHPEEVAAARKAHEASFTPLPIPGPLVAAPELNLDGTQKARG